MGVNKIYIPTFISSVTYEPVRVLPHVYFFNGTKQTNNWYVEGYTNSSKNAVNGTIQSIFPYFDNYSGNTPTSQSLSLLFNNETSVYGDTPTGSLYSEYWETYVNLLYNPRTRLINASAIIPLADYFKMELNNIVFWRGNYYHLRAINDYNLKTGECAIQLLGPIIKETTRETDCNFNFSSSIIAVSCSFDFSSSVVVITPTTTIAPTTTTTTIGSYGIEYLMLAGGGGGGYSNNSPNFRAGGGGAGGYISGSRSVSTSDTLAVVIGAGGIAGRITDEVQATNGGNTTFNALTAIGGGRGGSNFTGIYPNGGNGGSGGGPATTGTVGTGTAGQGFDGRASASPYGGNGGGAGAAPTTNTIAGIGKAWLDGNVYGQGGPGTSAIYSGGAGYGAGGHGDANDQATSGSNGIVIIRYSGSQIGTGGTVTSVGGYTYHTFTTSGTYTE